MDGRKHGRTAGWMDGWRDGWMDGWMDGGMNKRVGVNSQLTNGRLLFKKIICCF